MGPALLGTCLYGAVMNSFPTNEEKDAVGEIDATNEVERAGCAAALGLKSTLGDTPFAPWNNALIGNRFERCQHNTQFDAGVNAVTNRFPSLR